MESPALGPGLSVPIALCVGERRGKRKRSAIFPERTRQRHRQSDERWSGSNCNVGETSERGGGAHNHGSFRAHITVLG